MEGVVRTAMPRQSRKGSDRHQPKQFSKAKDGCGLARLGGRVLVWVGEGRGAERERERCKGQDGEWQEGQQDADRGRAHSGPLNYSRKIYRNLTACKVLESDFKTGISCS